MTKDPRLAEILDALQDIASGDFHRRLAISPAHDELDAIAHAVNVVGGELDYTTRRLAYARDDAENASAAKTQFLRNMSHELRTPASVIVGIVHLLQTEIGAARRTELYARIASNVRAQIELLDDLLDLSQIESGKLAIELRPTAVGPVLGELVESMEPAAQQKGLPLILDAAAIPPGAHVVADPRRLRQILINVIGNAIKFTTRGQIVVEARRLEQWIIIDVTDTGLGMDPADVERLFEPFTQADSSISRRFGGTGLGLALARRLAREMSGNLAIIATAANTGSTFRLFLPEHVADVADGRPADPARSPARLDGMRVLLVDDHDDAREPMALLLELRGATVVEAAGGRDAIRLGAGGDIDLILMDVRMPDIDGLEATRRLRALGVTTPIVALTADVVSEHRQAYLDAGCSTHLAKPIDIDHLIAIIRELPVAVRT